MGVYYPEVTDLETAKKLASTTLTGRDVTEWVKGWDIARKMMPDGHFGSPAEFNLGEAEANFERSASHAANAIAVFVKGTYQATTPAKAPGSPNPQAR